MVCGNIVLMLYNFLKQMLMNFEHLFQNFLLCSNYPSKKQVNQVNNWKCEQSEQREQSKLLKVWTAKNEHMTVKAKKQDTEM